MTYDSYKQCESITGYPKDKLKLAKSIGAEGFTHNRVDFDKFNVWLAQNNNKTTLEEVYAKKLGNFTDGRSKEEIQRSLMLQKEALNELEIKKKKGEYLDPTDVSDFLIKLRLSFEGVVKGWMSELPPKMTGKSQGEIEFTLRTEVTNLLSNFGNQITREMNKYQKVKPK